MNMKNKFLNPSNYLNFASNKALSLLAPAFRKWERPFLEKYGNQPLKHQPVFIIGAPRTGSTILYQTMTNMFDVLYIDNLACKLHRNFFFGFWLSNKLSGEKPHNNYQADHGRTRGLHSPSECGQFWYRWLPKDHHFIDFDEITPRMVEEIRREITAVINYFDKPLVFKNLNAGQRMRLLTKCFPEAKFIFITRDPVHTAQAILKSKRFLGLEDNDFWSIMPPNTQKLLKLDGYEQIVKQVFFLEKQIVDDSALVALGAFYTIHLKEMSVSSISELASTLGIAQRKGKPVQPEIYVNETRFVSETDFSALQEQVTALDWSFLQEAGKTSNHSSTGNTRECS
jgi:hypothetical protein